MSVKIIISKRNVKGDTSCITPEQIYTHRTTKPRIVLDVINCGKYPLYVRVKE